MNDLAIPLILVLSLLVFTSLHTNRWIRKMALDFSKLTAAETAMFEAVDRLIAAVTTSAAKLADVSAQLGVALAAGDTTAVQAQIDKIAADLSAEADKASAVTQASTDPAPSASPPA